MAENKDTTARKLASTRNAGVAVLSRETVQRYGSAAKEHLVAYNGVDNETGRRLRRSLRSIAKSKVTEPSRNTAQQAGFSAEVKDAANKNAENIISGKKTRKARMDDVKGKANDPLIDHVELDKHGNPVPGTDSQMKFLKMGKSPEETPEETTKALLSAKNRKYIENGDVNRIDIPSDQYKGVKDKLNAEIKKTEKAISKMKAAGKDTGAQEARLSQCKELKKKLRSSSVSTGEALEARTNPWLSTAKDVAKISHRAGVQEAKGAAAVCGGISAVVNVVALVKGDKDAGEAILCVVKDTAGAAATGYVTGAGGAALKATMQNSGSAVVRTLSKSNLPSQLVVATIETVKTLGRYLNGEIDGEQCLEELGEKGTGMVGGAMGAAVGTLIAGPIGTVVGSMVGYMLATSCYGELLGALRGAKLARAERIRVERECEEAIRLIRQYRAEMEEYIADYLADHTAAFHSAFTMMKHAAGVGDIDGFIDGANAVTRKLGGKPRFESMREFDGFMRTGDALVL